MNPNQARSVYPDQGSSKIHIGFVGIRGRLFDGPAPGAPGGELIIPDQFVIVNSLLGVVKMNPGPQMKLLVHLDIIGVQDPCIQNAQVSRIRPHPA